MAVGEADRGGGESGVTQIGATSLAATRVGSVEGVVELVVYAFLGGMAGWLSPEVRWASSRVRRWTS